MRSIAGTLLVVACGFLLVGGVRADEADRPGDPPADRVRAKLDALARGLELLHARTQATLDAAAILKETDHPEEALALLRGVDRSVDQGLARLEGLLERFGSPRGPSPGVPSRAGPDVSGRAPVAVRPGGAGGAFRSRGGAAARESNRTRGAVEEGLRWLAAHQSPDGGWEAAGFRHWCDGEPVDGGPDGEGNASYDVGVTGLSLLAFLGAGYTNRGEHEFARTVAKGLRHLKTVQDAEGCFGPRASQHFIYAHAAAALAMVEAYGMTGSPIFRGSAQRALDFGALARNPYVGWRYGVKPGDNDTAVTGAMLAAFHSARLTNEDAERRGRPAPLILDGAAFDGARAWVDKMTDPDTGRTGYIQRGGSPARAQATIDQFPADRSESMTAVGILIRTWSGEDPRRSKMIEKSARLLQAKPPRWDDGAIDMYYWTYGAMAAYQVGGGTWRTWARALQQAVVGHQRKDTDVCHDKGSWDPVGAWGADGGRVYATAMMTLALETSYRYDRAFGTP